MTSSIIYYDFRQANHEIPLPKPSVNLNNRNLTKGRRFLKTWANINAGLNALCLTLCGACISVSLLVFICLLFA